MTFEARIDDQGRVLIPREIRDSLGLQEDAQVELEVIRHAPLAPQRNLTKLQAALDHYGGLKRETLLSE